MNGPSSPAAYDLALVGGGLQNALIALAVLDATPTARIALIERGARLGGNHTWSFHAGDVSEADQKLVDRLVAHRWDGYDVAFPDFARTVSGAYASISSEKLSAVVEERVGAAPNAELLTRVEATGISARSVTLADGRVLEADLVVDARGPGHLEMERIAGYQKFVGLEIETTAPHALTRPTLIDACVPQTDGFRFFYALPLGPRRLLVEDTYFSDTRDLALTQLRKGILSYAGKRGWIAKDIVRSEVGVLPMPARGVPEASTASPLLGGYAGGWFHPATAYSFPVALRLARHIAHTPTADRFGPDWAKLVSRHQAQFRFATLLNRMLFRAFFPADRWHALSRFYRMPEPSIHRFYALESTPADRLRLLCGRPPQGISLRAALGASA